MTDNQFVKDLIFKETNRGDGTDFLYTAYIPQGRITVLDRLTGYGDNTRDIETGYNDTEDTFWLASCSFDIRIFPELTIDEAIIKIKENANTCVALKREPNEAK